jgi:hypothetical protein
MCVRFLVRRAGYFVDAATLLSPGFVPDELSALELAGELLFSLDVALVSFAGSAPSLFDACPFSPDPLAWSVL